MNTCKYNHIVKKEILKIKAGVFNALAHPLRLKILDKLRDDPCCVCKIISFVNGEQSNVSHHLAILKKAGIVRSEKRGLEVWYEVIDPRIFKTIDLMDECIYGHLQKRRDVLNVLIKRH